MKRFALLAGLVVLVFGAAIIAQQKVSVGQELIKLEDEWANAAVKGDIVLLDKIMADDYIWTDPNGVVWTKAESLAVLKSGEDKILSMVGSDMKARVYGDAAVVLGCSTTKETLKGKDVSGVFRFTDTWIKKAGRWVCVATHSSKIAGK